MEPLDLVHTDRTFVVFIAVGAYHAESRAGSREVQQQKEAAVAAA